MPYIDGKRVTMDEWQAANGSIPQQFHTGPDGENPAGEVELDADTGAPPVKVKGPKKAAGNQRSKRSEKAAKAAIANALGVSTDSSQLEDIDVSGLDADAPDSTEGE